MRKTNDPASNPMVALLQGLATAEGFSPSRLPEVRLMRASRHVPATPVTYDPSIVIIAQGRKVGRVGDREFRYDAHNYLVLSIPLPFECETFGRPEEPLYGVSIRVTAALVGDLLANMNTLPLGAQLRPRAIEATKLDPALSASVVRLLECLREEDDARILGQLCVREIAYRVLRGPLGANLAALAAPHLHVGQLSRILNRLHAEYHRPFDVESLAREAGLSVSAFHAHFKALTASSPLQYIKAIRLQRARSLIANEGFNAAGAAQRVGYESASQFSREFKRYFGGTPLQVAGELRRSRVTLA